MKMENNSVWVPNENHYNIHYFHEKTNYLKVCGTEMVVVNTLRNIKI